jgi:hypothetical protein
VSDTASREAATESSSTAEDPDAATATIRHPAVPLITKTTEPTALAEMESWYVDDESLLNEGEGGSVEEKHTSRSFVAAIYLFAHIIPRQAGFLMRDTRSRIRGSAAMIFMLWLRDFVVSDNYSARSLVWRRRAEWGGGGYCRGQYRRIDETRCTGARMVLIVKNGPIFWASHLIRLLVQSDTFTALNIAYVDR